MYHSLHYDCTHHTTVTRLTPTCPPDPPPLRRARLHKTASEKKPSVPPMPRPAAAALCRDSPHAPSTRELAPCQPWALGSSRCTGGIALRRNIGERSIGDSKRGGTNRAPPPPGPPPPPGGGEKGSCRLGNPRQPEAHRSSLGVALAGRTIRALGYGPRGTRGAWG